MSEAYVITTVLAAAANIYAASNDFGGLDWVRANMKRLKIPQHRLPILGFLKTAGAIGLVLGIRFPIIGVAAAAGLVLFFMGAIAVTIRARWYAHLPYPLAWLALAVGSLGLRLALR